MTFCDALTFLQVGFFYSAFPAIMFSLVDLARNPPVHTRIYKQSVSARYPWKNNVFPCSTLHEIDVYTHIHTFAQTQCQQGALVMIMFSLVYLA
jgi:hypothetical protein